MTDTYIYENQFQVQKLGDFFFFFLNCNTFSPDVLQESKELKQLL